MGKRYRNKRNKPSRQVAPATIHSRPPAGGALFGTLG